MNIQSAYDHWSATYDHDRNLTRDLDQVTMRKVFADTRYRNILELGCGTGKNTVLLAEISDALHALDFSEGMIKQARQKVDSGKVQFSVADLTRAWPIENDTFDLIVCNLVLEHIEDLAFILRQAFRGLKPGGTFYISELHPFRQYQGAKAHFQCGDKIMEVPAYVHHVSEFLQAASDNNLSLESFNEHWHQDDLGKPPRLAAFMFKKQ
ncbi:MAG: class I SAM-dependent methyltransferase [Arenimonas sp.]